MAIKVLLDTGVFISYFGRANEPQRVTKARGLMNYFRNKDIDILYSQRTQNELNVIPSETRTEFLNNCIMAEYFFGNETIDQIEGTSENIGSLSDNDSDGEYGISERINTWLIKDRDLRDRGILLDAIKNKCNFFIHENPKDYKKVPIELYREFNLKCINLLELEIADFGMTFGKH